MSDITKYTPLKTIIAYALDEMGKSNSDFDRCWILGLRAMTDMNQQFSAEPKTLRIPKNSNQTVTIPPDCIAWTKIGVLNNNGEVVTLKVNNALTTWADSNPQRLSHLTPDVNNTVNNLLTMPFYLNYYYSSGYWNLFGIGGGLIQYGECRVDERNNIVILSEDFKYDSIIFEYLSAPEKDFDYMCPTCLQEAVIAFIKWKLKVGDRSEYYGEQTKGRRSLPNKKVTLQTINQVLRESVAQKLLS